MATGKIRIVREVTQGGTIADGSGTERNEIATGQDGETGVDAGTEIGNTEAGTAETGTDETGTEAGTEAGTENFLSQGTVIDPATVEAPKRRGRKPGTKNKPKDGAAKVALNISPDHLLVTLHVGIAALLHVPELAEVDEDDMKLLRERFSDMSKAYGWKTMGIDPRLLATISMAETAAAIYAPRLRRAYKRAKDAKKPVLVNRETTGNR